MEEKINVLMGKNVYELKFPVKEYYQRLQWLKENGNIVGFIDEDYNYTKTENNGDGVATVKVSLDDITYNRYQ